jgi:hypothetical protein
MARKEARSMPPFAQITQGPPTTSGANPNQQALILDRQNNIVSSVGSSGQSAALQTCRQLIPTQTAITTITTVQTFWSKALSAGELNLVGRTYTLSGYGIYTTPGTTTPVATFTLVLGGVTIATVVCGAMSATASTNMPFQFEFTITVVSTGSAGTVEVHGEIQINLTANTPAGALSYYGDTNNAVSSAINMNSAATLALNVAANSAISSMQLRLGFLEVVC